MPYPGAHLSTEPSLQCANAKNGLIPPRNDPPGPHETSVVPIPISVSIAVIPILPANPLSRGEKRRVFPCVILPLRKPVFRHPFTEKEPSRGKGNAQKAEPVEPCVHVIPSCCDGGLSINMAEPFSPEPPSGRPEPLRAAGCFAVPSGTGSGGATDSLAAQQDAYETERILKKAPRHLRSGLPGSPARNKKREETKT